MGIVKGRVGRISNDFILCDFIFIFACYFYFSILNSSALAFIVVLTFFFVVAKIKLRCLMLSNGVRGVFLFIEMNVIRK
jgi:hypothetical protein